VSKKQIFTLGLKWLGIYCLALAIENLFGFSSGEFVRTRELAQTDGFFRLSQWLSLTGPVALSVLAFYLIKDGTYVREWVCRDEPDELMNLNGVFGVTVQLYGAYLVVNSIPNCFGLIPNVITVLFAPSYLSTSSESEIIRSTGISTIVTVSIGLCCVLREKNLTRFTFR
jgi:hypothetical protein